jgi:hypothetical protein
MRAKNVVSSMVVSSSTQSLTTMGVIGTNWRILKREQERRIQLEDGTNMQWAPSVRAKRRDVLTKNVVDALMEFWTNETKVNPNKWDVMKHRIMKNRWEEHATHFFEKPQVHFSKFLQFDYFYNFFFFVSACCMIYGCSWGLDLWL